MYENAVPEALKQMSARTLSPACPYRTPAFRKNTPPYDYSHPLERYTHSEADLMPGIIPTRLDYTMSPGPGIEYALHYFEG
jgi:hypothetical protein